MSGLPPARRSVLMGAALAGAAGLGLTACSGGGSSTSSGPDKPVDLGAADAVPVGGVKYYRDQFLLVSRPSADEYKALWSRCTHQNCPLQKIEGKVGICPCHGSRFDVTTGKVLQGPAGRPLADVPVKVVGGKLIAGPDKKA
ncbi:MULTISPECIES: Rieske (2Fe-2S) protein [unclassified Streptomyces]|uniref:Rieske (2Fe-2S) protein n=1 Tax=unclassified Streptomyces TaxID=2593676 RepID=UPI00324B666F